MAQSKIWLTAVLSGTIAFVGLGAPASAASSNGGRNEMSKLGYLQYLHTHCNTLMGQFDSAKSTNAGALALRRSGEEACYTNTYFRMEEGVQMLNRAITMVGLTPQKYP